MKKAILLLIGLFTLVIADVNAQCAINLGADTAICAASYTLHPSLSISTFEDSLEIIYDATQGQTSLIGATKVYMHSAAEMVPFGGWQNTIGNWGQDDGIGKMTNIGPDLWRIRLVPHLYYGYVANIVPNGLFMVFRNENGSATGKDSLGNDIWADMTVPVPVSAFSGVQFAWVTDALDSLHWSDNSNGQTMTINGQGTYWVQMTDTSGCIDVDSIVVNLGAIPVIDLGQPMICDANPVTLDAGAGYSAYAWSTGATTQTITLSNPATIMVTITNAAGCMGIDIVNVPSGTVPLAAFTPTVAGFVIQIADGSLGNGTYQWDFENDGIVDATFAGSISHIYQMSGTYTIQLVVTNFCGADTVYQSVTIGAIGKPAEFEGRLLIFPNPAEAEISFETQFPKGVKLSWSIVDAQNRTFFVGNEGLFAGLFRKNIDIHSLTSGLYHLILIVDGRRWSSSFFKL